MLAWLYTLADYWSKMLGMNIYSQTDTSAVLGYADDQVYMPAKRVPYNPLMHNQN